MNRIVLIVVCFFTGFTNLQASQKSKQEVVKVGAGELIFDLKKGTVDYRFKNGASIKNAVAYVDLIQYGPQLSSNYDKHIYLKEEIRDSIGIGIKHVFQHENANGFQLKQVFVQYNGYAHILLRLEVTRNNQEVLETRNISPLYVVEQNQGKVIFPWTAPKLVDLPFDNDNWLKVLTVSLPSAQKEKITGTSHELMMIYDSLSYKGVVLGSLEHFFWKTGISYSNSVSPGSLNELVIYGGAARADNPALPADHGGQDGTHDVMAHGTMLGKKLMSPLVFLESSNDVRQSAKHFGDFQSRLAGKLTWDGNAPFYWNSFGVEGVLGHEKTMMPDGVIETINFISSLKNINNIIGKPYLSIDSYDQGIYSTAVLKGLGDYAREKGQEIGFYCSPFSLWTWSNNIDHAVLPGTDVPLHDVILRDDKDKPIPFKVGEWGAFPMDPTHPATRLSMINQIEKAHAIGAKLIKIDFLTAGSFEAVKWYDPNVRSGMQAYDYGMKTFKHLVDSIMGNDVFITMAISPMFPHQYAHARFISTDVHSHLRDSQPGFEHYGSTASSMITASHMGWVQGSLWPYTNMDVLVMKRFQKHPNLGENEIKARLVSLITMGSILGDGSDYRDSLSAERARKYLDNLAVVNFFKDPKAFTPLKMAEGEHMDQQLSFFLPGKETLVSLFNFDETKSFKGVIPLDQLQLPKGEYQVDDFLTGKTVAQIGQSDQVFHYDVPMLEANLFVIKAKIK